MTADASIEPNHESGILGLANNATTKALLALIEELDQTRTVHPGTSLRLTTSTAQHSTIASLDVGRGQDV